MNSGIIHSELVTINNCYIFHFHLSKPFCFLKIIKWYMSNLCIRVADNQEACFHLPGCTCLTQKPIWAARREKEPQLWAIPKTRPLVFLCTITPMSLTLNSCDLLPSLSQHSSATILHCQDSEQANSNWLLYFLNYTQTNNYCGAGAWIQIQRKRPKHIQAFFHFSILYNCLLHEECPPFKKNKTKQPS